MPNPLITHPPTNLQRIEDLTRREFISSAFGAALLIACGDDNEEEPEADPTATPTAAPTSRIVESPLGPVEVPVNPQRIMALGEEFMLADLLDLGIKPIASTASGNGEFLNMDSSLVEGIQALSTTELDVESVVALQPDVMLAYTFMVEAVGADVLNTIAPTVAIDPSDYRAAYLNIAAVFGLEEKARARLAEYDANAKAAGEELDAASRSVSVVTVFPGASITVYVGGPIDLPQALLDMGFMLAPDAQTLPATRSSNRTEVSLEQVDLLTGDDLLMLQSSSIEGEDAAVAEVTANPVWQTIPAVVADRVHTVDRFAHPGVPGRIALVEELRQELAL